MCSRAAVHRLFSRSDLASGQKRWQVKISIYLNTMMTYLALRLWLRATPHSRRTATATSLRPGDSPKDGYGFSLHGRREPGNEVELVKAEISRSKYALVLPVEISST